MAYLSQYTLSLADVRALRLTDTYSIHRTVFSLFENQRGEDMQQGSGILYAIKNTDSRQWGLLILSDRPPRAPEYGRLETRTLTPEYLGAKRYSFEIVINPVRRENSSGKLIPLRGREAVADWFCTKAPAWGFTVHAASLLVVDISVDSFIKKGQTVTLSKARLTGCLDVTSSDLFTASVLHGIGRARAFGCGLLQIVPTCNA